jgi:hypothetical protein
MIESWRTSRGNQLWTLSCAPLHKEFEGEARKVALTGEVLRSASEDNNVVEI